MALPVVFIKAGSAVKKGAKAIAAGKQAKAVKDDLEQGEDSLIVSATKMFLVAITVVAIIILFFAVGLYAYPRILVESFFGGGSGSSTGGINTAYGATGTGPAASVVECARQQIGKPYVWGAEGPDSFDCSGLVTYCYRQALGVESPHQTWSIYDSSLYEHVSSANELRAGDLILFLRESRGAGHVGIYSGADTVIHAPNFNEFVREDSLERFMGHNGTPYFLRYKG